MSVRDRLLSHRNITSTGCWEWNGRPCTDGYAKICIRTNGQKRSKQVHRVSYEEFVGPIAEGMTIDHLCRNRLCFNPQHLEQCTLEENKRRGIVYREAMDPSYKSKSCGLDGHKQGRNLYVAPSGRKHCKACSLLAAKRQTHEIHHDPHLPPHQYGPAHHQPHCRALCAAQDSAEGTGIRGATAG